jgi:hypothetical protein
MGIRGNSGIRLLRKNSTIASETQVEPTEIVPYYQRLSSDITPEEWETFNATALDNKPVYGADKIPGGIIYYENIIAEKIHKLPGVTDVNIEDLLKLGYDAQIFDYKELADVLKKKMDVPLENRSQFFHNPTLKISKKGNDYYSDLMKKIRRLIGYNKPKTMDDDDYRNSWYLPLSSENPEWQDRFILDLNWNGPNSYKATKDGSNHTYQLNELEVRLYDKKYDINIGTIHLDPNRSAYHRLDLRRYSPHYTAGETEGFRQITPFGAVLLAGVVAQLQKLK